MNTEQSFGQLVKMRRRELGLTQDELARRVGCAPVTVRKIEYDDLRPSVQIAERLAMALVIPLEERAAFVRLGRAEREVAPTPTPAPAPEEIGAEDLTGRAIRGYALGERIGSGGMGAVYRAVQPLVEREVAVKIILPQYANHPEFIRRFEVEAQLVARLEHPHVVPLYDYWREPSVAFLVMRLLRGGSLRGLIESGPLPIEMAVHLLEQVGSALAAAHRAGVIHRDLKPANILLDEEHNAYLADFGIAKNLGNPNLEDQTQVDAIVGSPAYISPEQIRSEFVRPQTDIYALGVVLYELLTGHVPFYGPTPIEIMHQHLIAPLPPLAARRTGLPGTLDAVIERATAKDPMERYPDVDSLLADLRRAVRGEPQPVVIEMPKIEAPPLTAADNPYKGLRAFGEGDAADFFGREALTQQLLIRLGEGGDLSRFLAVVGPSGSGKSSVVGAGLVPAFRRGGLPGSDQWFIVELMPGAHPFEELEAALLRVAVNPPESLLGQLREDKRGLARAVRRCLPDDPNVELVLVIDQFEEVFTLVQEEAVRAHLLDSLVTAALDDRSRLRLIITLRADFTDRPLSYVDFGELVRQRTEFVLPLTPDELEHAIVGPAERAGLTLEPGLAESIIRDVGEQPGALPLLQYALTELFEKREGRTLTKAAYHAIGGVTGALGKRAEEVFTGLKETEQVLARQLFLRLVTLGEGVEDTRRRVLRAELEGLTTKSIKDMKERESPNSPREASNSLISIVIESFGHYRLLAFDRDPLTRGPTVEVAHEALLREWPRLREWLNESRADVRLQRQLASAAAEWQSANCDPSFLLTGARLAQFEGWAATSAVALTRDERTFLEACVAEREKREAEERARQQRELEAARKLAETEKARAEEHAHNAARLRRRAVYLIGALALAIIAALAAGVFGNQANRNLRLANQNLNAAQAASTQVAANAELARASAATAQAEALARATAQAQAEQSEQEAEQAAALSFSRELAVQAELNLTVDPERSILLALAALDEAYTYEAENVLHKAVQASRVRLTMTGHEGPVWDVEFSPDGSRLASGSADNTVKVWDAWTGEGLLTLSGHTQLIEAVAISPDGSLLASGSDDGSAKLWDLASGEELFSLDIYPDGVLSVAFSPDGTRLATAAFNDNKVQIWDTASGRELFALASPDWLGEADRVLFPADVAFSPDGTRLVIALGNLRNDVGRVEVWDLASRQISLTLPELFNSNNMAMSFSPDGTRLATHTSADGSPAVWDLESGRKLLTLVDRANSVLFTPDGKRLITASFGGKAKMWDAESGRELLTLVGHTGPVARVAVSPECARPLAAPFEWCGARLATASLDQTVRIWDISPAGEQEWFVLPGDEFAVHPEGNRLSTITWPPGGSQEEALLQEWIVSTGAGGSNSSSQILGQFATTMPVRQTALGAWVLPASGRLAVTDDDGKSTTFWDLIADRGEELFTLCCAGPDAVWTDTNRDETLFVSGHQDGTVEIWNLVTRERLKSLKVVEANQIKRVMAGPTEARVAIGTSEAIELWDLTTDQRLLTLPNPNPNMLAFSPDGEWLLAGDCTGRVNVWSVTSGEKRFTLSGHTACVNSIAFSPDGTRVAVLTPRGPVKVWDWETGQELLTLRGGGMRVQFSPDGSRLIVAVVDETALATKTVRGYLLRVEDLITLARSRVTRALTDEECQKYLHGPCP